MESSAGPDQNLASQLALRVALQTMKERCISLQKRLTCVEEENQDLRDRLDSNSKVTVTTGSGGGVAENFQLRAQVAELNRQKIQLSEHINMVATENRKLWSRLSQIAKEQNEPSSSGVGSPIYVAKDNNNTLTNDTTISSPRNGSANQNLIRSKTFTQHSPNPNLRHKLIAEDSGPDVKDISLEEVALETFPEKVMGADEEYAVETATEAELGFAYLNVDGSGPADDGDLNTETKKCIEGLDEIREEALKQQEDLNTALSALKKIVLNHRRECEKKSQKPEMADKSLETDESLNEMKLYNNPATLMPTHTGPSQLQQSNHNGALSSSSSETRINILQEKVLADELDKTCPMCGKIFSSSVQFKDFCEHVEMHFIDDSSDVEASLERNFEFISHAVGDF